MLKSTKTSIYVTEMISEIVHIRSLFLIELVIAQSRLSQ
jgi:hypothetical protein